MRCRLDLHDGVHTHLLSAHLEAYSLQQLESDGAHRLAPFAAANDSAAKSLLTLLAPQHALAPKALEVVLAWCVPSKATVRIRLCVHRENPLFVCEMLPRPQACCHTLPEATVRLERHGLSELLNTWLQQHVLRHDQLVGLGRQRLLLRTTRVLWTLMWTWKTRSAGVTAQQGHQLAVAEEALSHVMHIFTAEASRWSAPSRALRRNSGGSGGASDSGADDGDGSASLKCMLAGPPATRRAGIFWHVQKLLACLSACFHSWCVVFLSSTAALNCVSLFAFSTKERSSGAQRASPAIGTPPALLRKVSETNKFMQAAGLLLQAPTQHLPEARASLLRAVHCAMSAALACVVEACRSETGAVKLPPVAFARYITMLCRPSNASKIAAARLTALCLREGVLLPVAPGGAAHSRQLLLCLQQMLLLPNEATRSSAQVAITALLQVCALLRRVARPLKGLVPVDTVRRCYPCCCPHSPAHAVAGRRPRVTHRCRGIWSASVGISSYAR